MSTIPAGYKQTEVGVIPEDWNAKAIGGVIDLLTGFPFPSSGYSASGIRLLRGSNVKRGQTDWADEITQYWPAITQEVARYELREGDLVIAMDGSLVGRSSAKLAECDLPALLLQRVARIRGLKLRGGQLRAAVDAQKERELLAQAIGQLYAWAGEVSDIRNDRGGNYEDGHSPGKMDCIDHSTSTTRLLKMLDARGYLRWHRVGEIDVRRRIFVILEHYSAVIEEKSDGAPARFVVDSWFVDNGQPAVILPLDEWKKGAGPDV